MNYEEDIRIDEDALDIEWLEQPKLAIRYGKHYAECRRTLTQAEENIKIIRAELIRDANEDPEGCLGKGVKPTAPVVEAYYRNHKKHKDAKAKWVDAQYECDMAEIAKNEFSFSRKAALENLVTLHGQNYFAGPRVPRDISFEAKKRKEQSNADQAVAKMTRRNR